jgi:hypothetical protein
MIKKKRGLGYSVLLTVVFMGTAALALESARTSPGRQADSIRFKLKEAGRVSLAVYDGSGGQVRTLLAAEAKEKGRHEVAWDGLDLEGKPLPEGDYTWRLLSSQGLKAEYLLTLGTNPKSAPYDAWPGNAAAANAVAVDATGVYVGSSLAECTPILIKQSPTGKRLLTVDQKEAWKGAVSIASANGLIFVLQQNGKVMVMDDTIETKGWPRLTFDTRVVPTDPDSYSDWDLDAFQDDLVVCNRQHDLVRWYSADGKEVDRASVPGAHSVALAGDGTAYVVSQGRVVSLTRRDKTPRMVVDASQLVEPGRLSVDRNTGDLLVIDWGKSNQIKRFSSTGKLLRVYGREGGRRYGRYVATDFLNPSDIACDAAGGFYVSEGSWAPRRTAHFNRDGGLIEEWYGGQGFFSYALVDPDDPTVVWIESAYDIIRARVDYAKRTWRVEANYRVTGLAGGLIQLESGGSGQWFIRRHEGCTYFVRESSSVVSTVLLFDEKQDRFRAVAVADPKLQHGQEHKVKNSPMLRAAVGEDGAPQADKQSFIWTDANGDGEPSADEIKFSKWRHWGWTAGSIDRNFDQLGIEFQGGTIRRLPVAGWNAVGAPEYQYPTNAVTDVERDGSETIATLPAEMRSKGATGNIYRAPDGGLYGALRFGKPYGKDWPGNEAGQCRVVKWDPEGRLVWSVGSHATNAQSQATPPGEIHVPVRVVGVTHGCVIVGDRVVNPAMAWTEDGLYVGNFLDRRADDGLPDDVYRWHSRVINYDHLNGGSLATLPNGEVLWFANGWNNSSVYRITGWDGWERATGRMTIK